MDKRALRILEYEKIIEMLANECCSSLTREAALKLLPSYKSYWIEEELQGTQEALSVLMVKGAPPLGHFYDIQALVHLAAKEGRLTMKQLLEVAYNLSSARKTSAFLSSDLPELNLIDGLVSCISPLKDLEEEIGRCILSEDEMSDSASPELRRLRKAIVRQNETIKNKLTQIACSQDNQGFLQDAVVTMRQGRYVIPVKREFSNKLSGIVHDQSASGATLFIEPQVIVNMNNELRELELAEKKEMDRILETLSSWVGRNELQIKGNQEILFKLDYLFAKGRLAVKMNATRPLINQDGFINIKKGRHPLINPKTVVPVNIQIGKDFNTLIITGPNTGGKTVTLKTVGLFCLMAQAGLFVPAGEGTALPIFRNIYADIGDEQSIEQSLSTFSSHMKNIVEIVKGADSKCLVLVDELGAGTDPTEGAALAIAILERLYQRGAKTLATTHYTELKKYAIQTPGVQNASMEFNVETLSPTYRLTIGVPGKSNAFEISEKLGLERSIIENAQQFLEKGDVAFEDVLTSIADDKKQAEDAVREAENLRLQAEQEAGKIKAQSEKIDAKKEEILSKAKEEAMAILEDAQNTARDLQKTLAELNQMLDDETKRKLNKSLEEKRSGIKEKKTKYSSAAAEIENDEIPNKEDIKPGRRIYVLSVDQKGVVLSSPDFKGVFQVQVGSMKLNTSLEGVKLVKENVTEKQREKVKYSRLRSAKALSVPTSINVIGKNLDEASMEVDKYIDDAFLAGLEIVTVIHGRGAGILREGLGKMLKANKYVKSIRKGEYKEGGDGITVVTLKND